MKKRILALIICFTMSIMMLMGCSSSKTDKISDTASDSVSDCCYWGDKRQQYDRRAL